MNSAFGVNAHLVEEVIDLLERRPLLFPSEVGAPDRTWRILAETRDAVELCAGTSRATDFGLSSELNAGSWGSTRLLEHNMATGDDLHDSEVKEELSWTWLDLKEHLVAELIYTSELWKRSDRAGISRAQAATSCRRQAQRQR